MNAQAFRPASLALAAGLLAASLAATAAAATPTTFYPQADPSAQEQLLLELINRARANPAAEGQMLANITDSEILRYYSHYGVDSNRLRSDFASYQAQPPLAFNPNLMATSRTQSLDQATNGYQGHSGTNGSTFDGRISATGYQWHALGENVFAYVENPFFGHVGLNADWGVPSLDHRQNIMNANPAYPVFKEIGISCVASSLPGFGPLVITEDFGTPANPTTAYLVGVVYNDLNGNGAYDEGEGLAGVTISPDGGTFFTTTSTSGGFTLPLPTDASGSLTVTASGGSLGAARSKTLQFSVGTNVKVDFTSNDPAGAPMPQVAIKTVIKNVAADGNQMGVVTVSRSGDSSQALSVALNIGGSAVSGVDYSALPSSVTIPAGQQSVQLNVKPLAQNSGQVKKVKLQLAAAGNYTPDSSAATAKVKILQ